MNRIARSVGSGVLLIAALAAVAVAAPRVRQTGEPEVPACRPAHAASAPSLATPRANPAKSATPRAAAVTRKPSRETAAVLAPSRPNRLDPLMTL